MCFRNMGTNFGCVRASGYLLIVTSILIVSLTIADILVTYFLCPPNGAKDANCSTDDAWTWVASGLWTSIPVFVLGIWAILWSFYTGYPGILFAWILGFSYFVLVPLMVFLTSVEAYKYKDNRLWSGGSYDKLPIPITLACLGFVEFLIIFFLYIEVFCRNWSVQDYTREPPKTTTTTTTTTITPAVTHPEATGQYSTPTNFLPASRYPVDSNVPYVARVTTVLPSYGIYCPQSVGQGQTAVVGWNTPACLYRPQGRLIL